MTLIAAIKYAKGSMLATDTRVMIGTLKRDRAIKLEPLTGNIGIASTGLVGATDDILDTVKAFCKPIASVSFDDLVSRLSDAALEWDKKNSEKLSEDEEEEGLYSFIAVSPERKRQIMRKGYSEESHNYECDGSGKPYAEYLLGKLYRDNLDEKEAEELLIHTIIETSRIDPSVSEDIRLLVFPKDMECKTIDEGEIQEIKTRLVPISRSTIEEQAKRVERIVNLRNGINDLCKAKFGFRIFNANEKAVFQIMKPCRTEEEFTSNIAALALLIDQINVEELKKYAGEQGGSINLLQEFLVKSVEDSCSELISNFRDIMTLRSKKFPIHTTDIKFVEVVIKITGIYPPNWSDLYLRTLNSHEDNMKKLEDCLSKAKKLNN